MSSSVVPASTLAGALNSEPREAEVRLAALPRPRLAAALLALFVLGLALFGWIQYARSVERRYIHALAPWLLDQKNVGAALQAEAFRQPDLLPLYGSSELESYRGPYYAGELFKEYPTGFTVSAVGQDGATALQMLQRLAAVGPDLRGKKVAISLSVTWFIFRDAVEPDYYAGNFSRLQAGELAFSTDLSFAVKQGAARRMLQVPATLESDPLLRFALERLASGSAVSRALYCAVWPLGKLQNLVLELQDHRATLELIGRQPILRSDLPRQAAPINWESVLSQAERASQVEADNNPFGFDNYYWDANQDKLTDQKRTRSDPSFMKYVETATGWDDFDLLLHGLRDLGAEPLLLSAPMKGPYWDYWGVSAQSRRAYYRKVRQIAQSYGVQLVDFTDHDLDKLFVSDYRSHLSPKGWAYFDQALDSFYHR